MGSVRGTNHVFGVSGGEHSHKSWTCLLWVSGSSTGHNSLMERWQHSGGGDGAALTAGSPLVPVQQELESGASCCSWAGGHDHINSRAASGLSRQKLFPAAFMVPLFFHSSLISAELEMWDPFDTRPLQCQAAAALLWSIQVTRRQYFRKGR